MIRVKETLLALVESGVDFVVVGGVAATLHGSAFRTFDLDLCYSRESRNLERITNALAPFHPRLRDVPTELPFVWDIHTLRNGFHFTLSTDLGDLDLLGEIAGVGSFPEVKAASVSIDLFGWPVAVLSLDALISAKKAAGRDKDLVVLRELEALRELNEP